MNFAEPGVLFRTAPPAERMRPPLVARSEPLPKHIGKRLLPYWSGLEGPQGRTVDLTQLRAVRFIMAEKVDELVLRD